MSMYQSSDYFAHHDPDSPQARADASYNGVSDEQLDDCDDDDEQEESVVP